MVHIEVAKKEKHGEQWKRVVEKIRYMAYRQL